MLGHMKKLERKLDLWPDHVRAEAWKAKIAKHEKTIRAMGVEDFDALRVAVGMSSNAPTEEEIV